MTETDFFNRAVEMFIFLTLLFFPGIKEILAEENQDQGKSTAQDNAPKGPEKFIEPEDLQIEQGGMMNQDKNDGIGKKPFQPLVYQ